MSWSYSRVLVAEYLEECCSDTDVYALLNMTPTPDQFYWPDKTTEHSRLSRFGMMSEHLTENIGKELLMLFLADFLVRTSVLPEAVPDWTAKGQGYGEKWLGLLGRFDPDSCSLKTVQLSLLEDSTECYPTLPRWGLMLDGELYQQPIPALCTEENESGLWPTPTVCGNHNRKGASATSGDGLATVVKQRMWPTPCASASASASKGSSQASLVRKDGKDRSSDRLDHAVMASDNGQLNPDWVELLMGWPLGMTSLEPINKEEINGWKVGFAFKGLQDMRKNIQPETIQRSVGGCNDLHESEALQQNMRKQQGSDKASIASMESKKAQEGEMRGMRIHEESCSSSLRPGSNEQRSEQPSDSLQAMPRLLALYRQAPWEAGSWEDGVPRVANGVAHRSHRLKAIGNGQVPRVHAAAWELLYGNN